MSWFNRTSRSRSEREAGGARPNLPADLKLERLRRAVLDFPGRTEADLARIIYGRTEHTFVADEASRLEKAGMVTRDAETGGLYTSRR